ncbi:MAG: tRNA guanosine(34) transglycosylase Tgt [Bacteroidales bacterium]|mgnify:CR=1 FL=1|jgi:queuine tRNA-ribosyltransferase|nr:tRNA guanosine(34) transglycosylase Tgt [Bacteroidales bacterium]MDI9575266.1 tRNA guanosine(34) transglycosylase Tgt [Bacteroidota bacterium]MDD3755396.1 tRNA guanosine(34) transglycosylase Tgt [Bacteroidales bacterium]MDY0400400.1 tRNA guanosine(34) transglycosylase Tgt [Bacteroidales bacterium]HHW60195.1 tRNA guanosine(34) transglycosylase Tgt [Bacteroidales bacterium]
MNFEIISQCGNARAGILRLPHGNVQTPVFMPIGTVGSVKGIMWDDLKNILKVQIILANTYHLYLRPGIDILYEAGGLHKFINWQRPILSDSGGYQVYSLANIRKINDDGVEFRSHIDGSKHIFTPEKVMKIQQYIGSDIIMAFDECTPYPVDYEYAKNSLNLTHKWLERCIDYLEHNPPLYGYMQFLFPIVQGSIYSDLREASALFVSKFDTLGYAIGGLSVGEPADIMYEMIKIVNNILPHNKPRYLMGVGTPANILQAVALGVDMFDCVIPTRNGRNGQLFTSQGIINIKNKKWSRDFSPIDLNSPLELDQTTTKAYLRHLFLAGEMLGPMIASYHNLAFYIRLMNEIRYHILEGSYDQYYIKAMDTYMKRL